MPLPKSRKRNAFSIKHENISEDDFYMHIPSKLSARQQSLQAKKEEAWKAEASARMSGNTEVREREPKGQWAQADEAIMIAGCRQILEELFADEGTYAWQFYSLDDPARPELAKYRESCDSPMDLRIIQTKLENLKYKISDDFFTDMTIMLDNCREYFQDDSMSFMINELESAFTAKYTKMFLEDKGYSQFTLMGLANAAAGGNDEGHDGDDDDEKPGPSSRMNNIKVLTKSKSKVKSHSTTTGISSTITQPLLNHTQVSSSDSEHDSGIDKGVEFRCASEDCIPSSSKSMNVPASTKTEFRARPMNYKEKAKLLSEIYQLQQSDPDKINGLVEIIRDRESTLEVPNWDEFEIDVDILQDSTLRELEVYVAASLKKKLPKLALKKAT